MPLDRSTPVYPGDPLTDIVTDGPDEFGFHVSRISVGSHTGTHCDAPFHFVADGDRIDEVDLGLFAGVAVLIDVRHRGPRERITVFRNAIDTTAISQQKATITPAEIEALRAERFAGSANIGVYIGGLYAEKRVPFLLEAARAVRAQVPDFQLIVIGGGVDAHLVQAAAASEPWIHALGPMFGREKTLVASLGKVFLMPGLVGLGVLDSFAYGMPMVTCDLPFHSPEIDYLKDGVNGVMVRNAGSVDDYAGAVARVLTDDAHRAMLTANAAEAIGDYTIEGMAERFADGVIQALASPPNRGRPSR